MPLHEGLILYHGSYVGVECPDLSKCARFKDFGRGFYLTTSQEQAKSFAKLSVRKALDRGVSEADPNKGFISKFVVKKSAQDPLSMLEFEGADADWLRCIVAHRMRRTYPGVVSELAHYDVIAGKIANDQTNITLALYMDDVFGPVGSDEAQLACISQLLPERLKDQYCFRTKKALEALHYVGSDTAWM